MKRFEFDLYTDTDTTVTGPLPVQRAFHTSPKKYRAYIGGFGSGKTIAGCWDSLQYAYAYPGNLGITIRKTRGRVVSTTMKTFFEILANITNRHAFGTGDPLDPETCPLVRRFNKSELLLTFINGSQQKFMGVYTTSGRKEAALDDLKSMKIGHFHIDEASETPEDVFLMCAGRLRHSDVGRRTGIVTSNPSLKQHWIYKRFIEQVDDRYGIFRAPTSENIYLPPDYEDDLRANYDDDWVRRYLDGEFGFIAEGERVYPEFQFLKHISNESINPRFPIQRSWDFGWHHPACIIAQIEGDRLSILKEVQGENKLIEDFGRRVIAICEKAYGRGIEYEDYCDPAGNQKGDKDPRTSVDILKGLKVYCKSRSQFILDGVQIIKMLLHQEREDGRPGLLIHPDCTILTEGFLGGYHYPEKYDGSGEEPKPFKDGYYDHLQDCIRYLIWNTKFRTWLKSPPKTAKASGSFEYWMKLDKNRRNGVCRTIRV